MVKKANLLAGVVFALIFTFGCTRQAKVARNELVIWAMGEEGVRLPELVKLFKEKNPQIEVTVQSIPWQAAHEKLVTAVVGDIVPDVCQLGTTWMSEFQAMGALEQLDDYLTSSEIVKPENYYPGSWSTCVIDNRVYGIPWYVDTRVMFYRKDLFKKAGINSPPTTWEELIKFGKVLVEDVNRDGEIDKYAYAIPVRDWQVLLPFIWQNGGEIIDEKMKKPLFLEEPVKEAIEFYLSIFREKLTPTTEAGVNLYHAFKTGYYKMFFSGPWMLECLKRELPELYGKWDVAIMPSKKIPASFVGGSNLVIFKSSKNKKNAWKFIEFVSTPEIQVKWYKITTDLPAVKSAWKDNFFTDKPMLKTFAKQLEWAKAPPNLPEWEQIADVINTKIEEVVLGKKSVEEALASINAEVTQILNK